MRRCRRISRRISRPNPRNSMQGRGRSGNTAGMDLSANSRRAIGWIRSALGGIASWNPANLLPNSGTDDSSDPNGEPPVDPVVITKPKNTWGVNCCNARLSGMRACHCTTCHRNFSGNWAFDKHRAYGKCRHPEEVGLVPVPRWFPCWGSPTDEHPHEKDE